GVHGAEADAEVALRAGGAHGDEALEEVQRVVGADAHAAAAVHAALGQELGHAPSEGQPGQECGFLAGKACRDRKRSRFTELRPTKMSHCRHWTDKRSNPMSQSLIMVQGLIMRQAGERLACSGPQEARVMR